MTSAAADKAKLQGHGPGPVDEDSKKASCGSDVPLSNTLPAKRNAFSELMSTKSPKAPKPSSALNTHSASVRSSSIRHSETSIRGVKTHNSPRLGLLPYIENPSSFPKGVVLRMTDDTVLIRDLYPKATIHLLLLPRSPAHYELHPHEAFTHPEFLALVKREIATAIDLAASELSRLISPFSAACRARNEAMDMPNPPSTLPPGRDFHRDLHVGIHAHPSMHHLHIHIISRDMHSSALKHRKHYNSFNTDFFIPLADYPLPDDDQRRSVTYQNANLSRDFVCWRCGTGFGNKFTKLKEHLEKEYLEWRAE